MPYAPRWRRLLSGGFEMIDVIEAYLSCMADGYLPGDCTDDHSIEQAAIAYDAWLKLREALGI